MPKPSQRIRPLKLPPGSLIGDKYRVEEFIGSGWEGEVYRVSEARTGIARAAKLFYPKRNPKGRTSTRYARRLERLRHCPIVMQYHHSESVRIGSESLVCLISELVEGVMLDDLVRSRPGRRLEVFEGLAFLHSLAVGLECIHAAGGYHGDLHSENVLVRRRGIHFDLKLLDFFDQGRAGRENAQHDVIDAIRLFYDALGGRSRYARQPEEVRQICRGLRHDLIRRRFPTAARLRSHLEAFPWA